MDAPKKTKPAGPNGEHRTIIVSNWKPLNDRSRRGSLTLTLPSGIVIHNCRLVEGGGRRWVSPPARCFPTFDGGNHYQPIVEFATPKARRNFERYALDAVERFLRARGEW